MKFTNPFAKPQHIQKMENTLTILARSINNNVYNEESENKEIDRDIARYREITEILETQRKQRLSKEKKAEIIAYLIGILLILNYEHARALTSKATNQLPRILR